MPVAYPLDFLNVLQNEYVVPLTQNLNQSPFARSPIFQENIFLKQGENTFYSYPFFVSIYFNIAYYEVNVAKIKRFEGCFSTILFKKLLIDIICIVP